MVRILLASLLFLIWSSPHSQTPTITSSVRVAIAGLVHGHVSGFLERYQHRRDVQIVGIAEADHELASQYAQKFGLQPELFYSDLEDMLQKTHPQAVLTYTNTFDHRRVVEICARYGVHVMMEKPLAVSVDDAHAIQKFARAGKIYVLVNYETTWYPSNHAVHDMVRQHALGDVRKIVVHDGHSGPKEIGVGPEFLSWLTDPKLNGAGALFDFGCYGADLATWLMGRERPTSVTAVTQQIKANIYPRVDDEATIIVTYPKAQVIIQASWNWPFDRKDMEVYGTSGYAVTMRREAIRLRRGSAEEQFPAPPVPSPYDDPISELRAVILQGIDPDPLSSLQTNIIVTEMLDAARKSATTGRTVAIQQN